MKYSIIIAVYNRLEEVKELLESAEKLEGDRRLFELLFVDDGSKDGFKEFIEQYRSASGLQIRAIYQQNQGPGAARNYGMSKAQGEYFIFVDSDCMFPPQWLAEIEKAQNEHHYDAFGGPDTCHPSFSPLLKAINYSMTSFIGTGGTRGNKKHVGRFYPRSFNMGISRKVYDMIGGMGGLRHGQDMDYSMRIYNAGFKVGLIADAYVYHKRRTSIPKFFRQIFNWGVARINLSRRHPHTLPHATVIRCRYGIQNRCRLSVGKFGGPVAFGIGIHELDRPLSGIQHAVKYRIICYPTGRLTDVRHAMQRYSGLN